MASHYPRFTFENLATKWGRDEWVGSDGKESCELYGVEAWTDDGWTKMHRVIRHRLATHKKIVRVLTHTGLVDVTDEQPVECRQRPDKRW